MEEKIKEFLASQSIERLSIDDAIQQLEDKFGRAKVKEAALKMLQRKINLDFIPLYYDSSQTLYKFYDARLIFLPLLIQFLESLLPSDVAFTIGDGGCAAGLDVCFLASYFYNTDYDFVGYDYQRGMIERAKVRRKRLGLDNVRFYMSDHSKPRDDEIGSVDVLYTKSALDFDKNRTLDNITSRIVEVCQRVRAGGWYVSFGEIFEEELAITARLEGEDMHLVSAEKVTIAEEIKDTYFIVFQVQA